MEINDRAMTLLGLESRKEIAVLGDLNLIKDMKSFLKSFQAASYAEEVFAEKEVSLPGSNRVLFIASSVVFYAEPRIFINLTDLSGIESEKQS